MPGSRGHYTLDARTFAEWRVDYVKLDWCGDIKKEPKQGKAAHEAFARAMNASGRAMFLEVVAGYFFLGARIGSVANAWRFCEDHKDSWGKTREQLACRDDQLNATGGPGAWASMDVLATGGAGCAGGGISAHCAGMSDDEYRTEFSLWALTQSPLLVATDVRNLTAVMRQALLNEELVDLHQATATPPGGRLAHWRCTEPLACQVWGRRLTADGADWMVALVNLGSRPGDHRRVGPTRMGRRRLRVGARSVGARIAAERHREFHGRQRAGARVRRRPSDQNAVSKRNVVL